MREIIMHSNICTTHTHSTATFNVGNSETDRWARTIGANLAGILGMERGIQKAWLHGGEEWCPPGNGA